MLRNVSEVGKNAFYQLRRVTCFLRDPTTDFSISLKNQNCETEVKLLASVFVPADG